MVKPRLGSLSAAEGTVQDRGSTVRSSSLWWLLIAILLVGLGSALVADAWLTVIVMVAVVVGVPSAWIIWRNPEVGIVLLIFLGSQILHPELLDLRLPIGGGLELPDLVLLGLAGLLIVKQALRLSPTLPTSRLLAPFGAFFALALFSALRAMVLFEVEVSWSMGELRGIAYFSVMILATWQLTRREQIKRLLAGLLIVGLATVGVMFGQQFFGSLPFVGGQEATGWQIIDVAEGGITRIRPPAHVLLYFLSIVALALMGFADGTRQRIGWLGLAVLLNLVMLLTFTRSQWLASGMAILICLALFPRAAKLRLASIALAGVLAGIVILLATQSNVGSLIERSDAIAPLADRAASMVSAQETLDSYSLQTRQYESEAALESIAHNPILGVGLGNSYRGLNTREAQNRYTRFTRFIENSYLYIAAKMGLPSLAVFGWLITAMIVVSYRAFKFAKDPMAQALGVASFATLVGLVFWGYAHPVMFMPEHTLMVGLIGGMGEAVWRMNS